MFLGTQSSGGKKWDMIENLVSFLYVNLFAQGSGSPQNTEETALDLVAIKKRYTATLSVSQC